MEIRFADAVKSDADRLLCSVIELIRSNQVSDPMP